MFQISSMAEVSQVSFGYLVEIMKTRKPTTPKTATIKAEQEPTDDHVGLPLLLGAGVGNAEGGDEGLGQPGK